MLRLIPKRIASDPWAVRHRHAGEGRHPRLCGKQDVDGGPPPAITGLGAAADPTLDERLQAGVFQGFHPGITTITGDQNRLNDRLKRISIRIGVPSGS